MPLTWSETMLFLGFSAFQGIESESVTVALYVYVAVASVFKSDPSICNR